MPLSKQWFPGRRSRKKKEVNPEYRQYLRSKHWQEVKAKALEAAEGYCQRCNKKKARLNVHHKHYKSLGHEKLKDLAVLCPKCHAAVHREEWW